MSLRLPSFAYCIGALACSACFGPVFAEPEGRNDFIDDMRFYPVPAGMGRPDPQAPYKYKRGWHDGCKSGFAASGNSFYKSFYKYTVTMPLYSDKMYYRAWKDASTYCKQYVVRWHIESLDSTLDNYPALCVFCPPSKW